LKKPLPNEILASAAALVSCVAGVVLIDETIKMAKQVGLCNLQVDEKPYSIDIMADCNDPLYKQVKESLPQGAKLNDYIISVDITAYKIKE